MNPGSLQKLELNNQDSGEHDKQINDKFNDLIKKIECQRKLHEAKNNANGELDRENSETERPIGYNKDKALKLLYDESVEFKNNLSKLRSSIKTLNGQFNSYDLKCKQLIEEESGEYKSLKGKIEREKERLINIEKGK